MAQTTSPTSLVPAFAGRHEPKPHLFDASKLPGLSERLIRSHWDNNYCGAVKALNAVEQRLAAMLDDPDLPPYVYGDLKREELLRTGSVRLHELHFGNLGGDGKPGGAIDQILAHEFGTLSRWEAKFRRTANALAGGSGWVILAMASGGELHNYWAWDHSNGAPGSRPLLVLEMYEHAYHGSSPLHRRVHAQRRVGRGEPPARPGHLAACGRARAAGGDMESGMKTDWGSYDNAM